MRPWMIAALFGAMFGMISRQWLSIEIGRGQSFDISQNRVLVVIGTGNQIVYNPIPSTSSPLSDSSQELSHAEGA